MTVYLIYYCFIVTEPEQQGPQFHNHQKGQHRKFSNVFLKLN